MCKRKWVMLELVFLQLPWIQHSNQLKLHLESTKFTKNLKVFASIYNLSETCHCKTDFKLYHKLCTMYYPSRNYMTCACWQIKFVLNKKLVCSYRPYVTENCYTSTQQLELNCHSSCRYYLPRNCTWFLPNAALPSVYILPTIFTV